MTLIHQHPEWVFAAGCGLIVFTLLTTMAVKLARAEVSDKIGVMMLLLTLIGCIMVLYGGYRYLSY